MSFIKIDICKAGAFRPNVCGRRGKRSCKQQQRRQEGKKKGSAAQLLVAAPPRAQACFCKASTVVAVVAFVFLFFLCKF